jgi:hypothetical protein
LILDEDGLYDPAHFNDRLLLGLKGTMSEAELHVLRARLRGGIVNKARRGELEVPLPVGFVYDAAGRVGLDPVRQVQETLRAFFQTFRRTGSATATVKAFRDQQLPFPRRARAGAHQGETLWGRLEHSRALWVLHNPRYAGAFFFGRSRQRHTADARLVHERLPRDESEADLARRRYLQVDPANRLVADELEAHWNRALQQVTDAQETSSGNGTRTAWPSTPRPGRGFWRSRATSLGYGTTRARLIANGSAWSACSSTMSR